MRRIKRIKTEKEGQHSTKTSFDVLLSFSYFVFICKDVAALIENVASKFKLTLGTVCVQFQKGEKCAKPNGK